ncbi:hypothetical protein DL93DRAFT_527157 [Clavulina sp. PMI_390]|nr:hypothetical protein DL93DRAFT_527157 [Clavulina sp. PMI_390]
MPVSVPRLSSLVDAIPPIFMQCQNSLANHRKNVVALAKIHAQTSDVWEEIPPRGIRLTGEKAFNDKFIDMVDRILPIKKGIANADRIVKFVRAFIEHIAQKAAQEKAEAGDDDEEESPASRLVASLLKHLLKGFNAKDKVVRSRVVQVVADLIFAIGELDEDLYSHLRASLLERVRDKESHVRFQAAIALARLQRSEEGSEEEDEENLLDVLTEVLQFDPSPEVRHGVLTNLPVSPDTLPVILTRMRDQEKSIRRVVFHRVLAGLPSPSVLTIAQREEICNVGLGDREPTVRVTAAQLIGTWVDKVGGIEGFLKLLDVSASNKVAEDTLSAVFQNRPDLTDEVDFDDKFWAELTPERAFLARVFVDHCKAEKDDARLEATLPVVTAFAFRIQHEYNALMQLVTTQAERQDDEEDEDAEMELGDKIFIISELLRLAVNLDYADETGRRKTFALIREMASAELLPEDLVTRCLDVLRVISANERELFMLIVEIIHELRDAVRPSDDSGVNDDESMGDEENPNRGVIDPQKVIAASNQLMESMDPETRARWEEVNLRCLTLSIGTLERVNGTLEDNSILDGLLTDFALPAIYQKHAVWRERGVTLLGLMCLISKNMAQKSAQLFLSQAQPEPKPNTPKVVTEIQLRALHLLFDIVMVFHFSGLEREGGPKDGEAKILHAFEGALRDEYPPEIHAVACEGMAKLMLSGIVTDENVLARLVSLFLDPGTVDNQALRQCLSYFFPVYCYSSPTNQRRMQKIFLNVTETMYDLFDELEEHEEMVTPAQIGLMLVDWTDPSKAVKSDHHQSDDTIHVDVAIDIVRALFDAEMLKERRKSYVQLLSKLYIPEEIDDDKLRTLMLLISYLRRRRPLRDTVAKNALSRFETSIAKKFAPQLEAFNEEEFRELQQMKELFEFIDTVESDAEEEIPLDQPRRSNSKTSARSRSQSAAPASQKGRGKPKAKAPVEETIDEEDEEEPEEDEQPAPKARSKSKREPPAKQSRRAAPAAKPRSKKVAPPPEDEEDEEDEEEEGEPAPRSKRSTPSRQTQTSTSGRKSNKSSAPKIEEASEATETEDSEEDDDS